MWNLALQSLKALCLHYRNAYDAMMTYLVLQSHVIKESCDFMGEIPSRSVTTITCLVAIDIVVVET